MNSLVQRARELSESAQSRIDFREAIPIYADFAEELQKDTQLDSITSRQVLSLASASQELLSRRWEFAVDLEGALRGLKDDLDQLQEPEASRPKEWSYHVLFNGS